MVLFICDEGSTSVGIVDEDLWMKGLLFCLIFFCVWGQLAGEEADKELDWESINFFESDLDRAEFERVVAELFAPFGGGESFLRVEDEGVWVSTEEGVNEDRFLSFRYIRPIFQRQEDFKRGLVGLKIALDPGHLGGEWAEMEERSIVFGDKPPVREGDLALATARRLRDRLEKLGAIVWLTRDSSEPATALRPEDFMEEATAYFENEIGLSRQERDEKIRKRAERLFYRRAEIQQRAVDLNTRFKPDIAIALHLNAAEWDNPDEPALVDVNNAHILVHGSYLEKELEQEGARYQFLRHIAKQYYKVEVPLARSIEASMVAHTKLEPYEYSGHNAKRISGSEYIWSRNLLANRLFDCPVVYLEPWILNSKEVYPWALLGDYEGAQKVDGVERLSLPHVYSDFVVEGIVRFYERTR